MRRMISNTEEISIASIALYDVGHSLNLCVFAPYALKLSAYRVYMCVCVSHFMTPV